MHMIKTEACRHQEVPWGCRLTVYVTVMTSPSVSRLLHYKSIMCRFINLTRQNYYFSFCCSCIYFELFQLFNEWNRAECCLICLHLLWEQTKELWVLVFNVTAVNFDLSLTISGKPQISSSKLADCMWHVGRPGAPQDGRLAHQWSLRHKNITLVTLNLFVTWYTLPYFQMRCALGNADRYGTFGNTL